MDVTGMGDGRGENWELNEVEALNRATEAADNLAVEAEINGPDSLGIVFAAFHARRHAKDLAAMEQELTTGIDWGELGAL